MGIANWPHLSSNFSFWSPSLSEVLGRLSAYQEETFVRFTRSYYGHTEENEHLHNLNVSVFYFFNNRYFAAKTFGNTKYQKA